MVFRNHTMELFINRNFMQYWTINYCIMISSQRQSLSFLCVCGWSVVVSESITSHEAWDKKNRSSRTHSWTLSRMTAHMLWYDKVIWFSTSMQIHLHPQVICFICCLKFRGMQLLTLRLLLHGSAKWLTEILIPDYKLFCCVMWTAVWVLNKEQWRDHSKSIL